MTPADTRARHFNIKFNTPAGAVRQRGIGPLPGGGILEAITLVVDTSGGGTDNLGYRIAWTSTPTPTTDQIEAGRIWPDLHGEAETTIGYPGVAYYSATTLHIHRRLPPGEGYIVIECTNSYTAGNATMATITWIPPDDAG